VLNAKTGEVIPERFRRDPLFATLVKVAEDLILRGQATPTELREAVTLAATRIEMQRLLGRP
jgi:hypothetical protein